MKIETVGAVAQDSGIKAMIHGPSGSGKTYSIATIPNQDRVLILSAEAGLLSLKDVVPNTDVAVISTVEELREVYDYVEEGEGRDKYDTVVLDSLTEIAQQVLSAEMGKTKDGRKAYGEMNNIVIKLVKAFRDLRGKNVILICQQAKVSDSDGRIFYGPMMPGKTLTEQLPYTMDLVGCLRTRRDENGEVERTIQFAELDEYYLAKNRGGKLDDYEDVNWTAIFGKIQNTKKKKGAK